MSSLDDLKSQLASITGATGIDDSYDSSAASVAGDSEPRAPAAGASTSILIEQRRSATKQKFSSSRSVEMYQNAEAIKEKKKKLLAQPPPGCSFSPSISGRSKRLASKKERPDSTAFQRLYSAAQDQKKKLEVARSHANAADKLTFQPKINRQGPAKSGRGRGQGAPPPPSAREARQRRFDSLYSDAKKTRSKIEKARKKIEAKEHPFKPKITKRGTRSPSPGRSERFQQLYNDGSKTRTARLRREKLEKEKKECTFKPRINRRSASARRARPASAQAPGDVYSRLYEAGKRTSAKLAKKREAQEAKRAKEALGSPGHDADAAEKSSPSARSGLKLRNKKLSKFAIDESVKRLAQYQTEREERIKKKSEELAKKKNLTFKPSIRKYRRPQSARRSRPEEEPQTKIWDRLHHQSQDFQKKQARLKKAKAEDEIKECTFKPDLSKSFSHSRKTSPVGRGPRRTPRSRSPSPAPGGTPAEKQVPVWERLSYDARMTKELRDELLAQEQREMCRVRKHHNNTTRHDRKVADQKPIWQRLLTHKKDYAALEAMKEVTEMQGCTFSPDLSKSFAQSLPHYDERHDHVPVWERFHARPNRAEKTEMLEAQRRQKEETVLKASVRRKSVSRKEYKSITERLHTQTLGNIRRDRAAAQRYPMHQKVE